MEEENLFNASEIIDGLIEIYTSEYHGGVTEKGLIDFAKKIITISQYEKDTLLYGKMCRTCKYQTSDKEQCVGCGSGWSKWKPKYTKEDFGV